MRSNRLFDPQLVADIPRFPAAPLQASPGMADSIASNHRFEPVMARAILKEIPLALTSFPWGETVIPLVGA
jgi:hypothetical protein